MLTEELPTVDNPKTRPVYNNITGDVIWGVDDEIRMMSIDDAANTKVSINSKYSFYAQIQADNKYENTREMLCLVHTKNYPPKEPFKG